MSYLIRRVLAKPRLILDEMCRLYRKFASYLRRVLCKARLIFPRINGPIVLHLHTIILGHYVPHLSPQWATVWFTVNFTSHPFLLGMRRNQRNYFNSYFKRQCGRVEHVGTRNPTVPDPSPALGTYWICFRSSWVQILGHAINITNWLPPASWGF